MTIGQSHEVAIGGVEYRVKFGATSVFEHTYQNPFVDRTSVAVSRSEGDYSGDLVFTQSSWNQGEGQKTMRSGGESSYWDSTDLNIAGDNAGIELMKSMTNMSANALGLALENTIHLESSWDGIWMAYKNSFGTENEIWHWDGSAWTGGTYQFRGLPAETIAAILPLKGYIFMSYGTGIMRAYKNDGTAADWNTAWCTTTGVTSIGTDGDWLYFAVVVSGVGGVRYSKIYKIAPTGASGAGTLVSSSDGIEGVSQSIKPHAGNVFILTNVTNAQQAYLYRYDGANFVLWKTFPAGFLGGSMRSDGSVLYISGRQKCSEGNYRGQIYYITGSSGSETLGNLATIGERDGVSDYYLYNMRPNGKSLYFPWSFYGGVGRYDTINGGISKSYRQQDYLLEGNKIERIVVFDGDIYISVTGSGGSIWKTQSTTYQPSGTMKTSYVNFGLPVSQKLYTKAVIVTPTDFASTDAGIAVSYSTDGDTNTWTSLGSLEDLEIDSDSSTGFYKYTLALPGNGIKAHSLALKLTLTTNDTSVSPMVTHITTVAKPLLNIPGATIPNDVWRMNLVIADNCRTLNDVMESGKGGEKLANLRTLFKAQEPTTLESISDSDTHNILITRVSEISPAKAKDNSFEATVTVECVKI